MTHHIIFFETTAGRRYLTTFRSGEPCYTSEESKAKKYKTLKRALVAKRRAMRWMSINHYDAHIHPEAYAIT